MTRSGGNVVVRPSGHELYGGGMTGRRRRLNGRGEDVRPSAGHRRALEEPLCPDARQTSDRRA